MPQSPGLLPGQRDLMSVEARGFLWAFENLVLTPIMTIDATNSYDGANTSYETTLREGTWMAQITASKKWVPCKRTTTTSTGAVTALVVVDARTFMVGETISVGADTGLVISAINYTTNTITIPSTTVASGEAVVCTTLKDGATAAAGCATAKGILYGYQPLTDDLGVLRDRRNRMVIAGCIDDSTGKLFGDTAAIKAADKATYASSVLNGMLFASSYGLA